MENILISLFGGGILDWRDISQTNYDWEDIFDRAKNDFNFDNADINTLYFVILEMALEELKDKMEEIADECSKEFQDCARNIEEYFNIYTNCLDTHIRFNGSEELAEEIQEKLEDEIDDIDHNIGFTYINFN